MIKELSELFGPSGHEDMVAGKIKTFLSEAVSFSTDAIGNAYAVKEPSQKSKGTIMLCAHMDEVGLIISSIHPDGTLAFQTVGGISASCLLGKRVRIGNKNVLGVIGTVAVHLLSKEEKERGIPVSKMYIDIGANDADEAERLVALGDYAVFDTDFSETGTVYRGKALDDRLGCAAIIEILNSYQPENFRLVGCFTVQEETGIRGAKVAARKIKPDLALVFETTTCNDLPNVLQQQRVTTMGEGIALSVADAYTIYPHGLKKTLTDLAEKKGIPYQFKKQTYGGNDCGSISIANGGTPVAVLSVPCRYLHTPVSVAARSDYRAGIDLAVAFLQEMETQPWNF